VSDTKNEGSNPTPGIFNSVPALIALMVLVGLGALFMGAIMQSWLGGFHAEAGASQTTAASDQQVARGILVIDSGRVAAAVLQASHNDAAIAVLASRPAALGGLVGKGIRQAAAKYAAEGYVVLDSSAVLGSPSQTNVTDAVTMAVMQDAKAAAGMLSKGTASGPAEPALPPPVDETSGRLP
jgi:hypothetical protein